MAGNVSNDIIQPDPRPSHILGLAEEVEKEVAQLEFDAKHLIAEDDKDDALRMLSAARSMMLQSAARLRAVLIRAPRQ